MAASANAPTLRIFGGDPSVDDRQRGHAKLPHWIMALPDLHPTGKVVLEGLIGACFNGERTCRIQKRRLADKTGLKVSVVKYWLIKLVETGFILRPKDQVSTGETWETTLLFDPLGLEDTRPKRYPAPANPLAGPGQPVSPPRLMDSPPTNKVFQAELIFSEIPEAVSAPPRESNPESPTAQPQSPDPYRGPRNPGRPPAGYRTVYSQGSPRDEGARPGLEPELPRPDPDDPEVKRGQDQLAREGIASYIAAAQKENRLQVPLESPLQPAGAQIHSSSDPDREHSVKACPRQETRGKNGSGQRAPAGFEVRVFEPCAASKFFGRKLPRFQSATRRF